MEGVIKTNRYITNFLYHSVGYTLENFRTNWQRSRDHVID